MALKVLTIYAVICSEEDIKASHYWISNGFNPPSLNIVLFDGINVD